MLSHSQQEMEFLIGCNYWIQFLFHMDSKVIEDTVKFDLDFNIDVVFGNSMSETNLIVLKLSTEVNGK